MTVLPLNDVLSRLVCILLLCGLILFLFLLTTELLS